MILFICYSYTNHVYNRIFHYSNPLQYLYLLKETEIELGKGLEIGDDDDDVSCVSCDDDPNQENLQRRKMVIEQGNELGLMGDGDDVSCDDNPHQMTH